MIYRRILEYLDYKLSDKIGGVLFKDTRKIDLILSILTMAIATVSVTLFFFGFKLIGLSLLSAVAAVVLSPILYALAVSKEYESKVMNAALTISLATYVMSVLGKDIIVALRALAKGGNAVADVESRVLTTKVKIFGKSVRDALNERAQSLSGTPLAQLYRLYVAAGELGFSLSMKLEDFVKGLLSELSQSIEHRINTLVEISEATLSLFILLPMLAMGLSILSGVQFGLLLIPLLTAPGLYFLIATYSFSPRINYQLSKSDVVVAALGMVAIVYFSVVLNEVTVISLAFGLTLAVWFYFRYYKPAEELFDRLPLLATIVGDKVRLGHSFNEALDSALIELSKHNWFLKRGVSLYRSGYFTFMKEFVDIAKLAYEGSFTGIYDDLSRIYSNIVMLRKDYQRKASTFLALAIISPGILYYELHTFSSVVSTATALYSSVIAVLSFALATLFSKAYKGTLFFYPIYVAVGVESLILSALWA